MADWERASGDGGEVEFLGEFWVKPTIRSYFSTFLLAATSSRFKFSFSCSVSARMAAS
jgi:hypothetical protein